MALLLKDRDELSRQARGARPWRGVVPLDDARRLSAAQAQGSAAKIIYEID
ncbi:hypothetical protein [Aestuariicoccus sp. MJ-SS9]|uniref:hypothetical protein n=1 Tax=Aestuariicoccus sp. MJ-SS9 TaxID=3079855 RepID=UPI00291317C7|nr:hypothetical protein [Aestuariicoccus sp. MJ-SS9]MDU8910115.1 hypothetical protein [Aestuariicoccus sp. MJ-SS9]